MEVFCFSLTFSYVCIKFNLNSPIAHKFFVT